jgi:hypothetical protein
MDFDYFNDRLSKSRTVFEGIARDISLEQARWKPSPDKWSILEVINHLHDEEKEDFRQRLGSVLSDPSQPWPSIDPRNWVTGRALR